MNKALTERKCVPCEGIGRTLEKDQALKLLKDTPGWQMSDNGREIYRDFLMKNFMAAVNFIRKIADVAEAENHHPDLHLEGYRRLKIVLSTHALGGLSENDFIVAAKINALPVELKG